MDYVKLLEKARKELPDNVLKSERFEVPKVQGHIQGNKTIISNFNQIASIIGRSSDELLKFVLKEIAAPGELIKQGASIGRKVSSTQINEKIAKYVKELVICPECKKPDTKLVKDKKFNFIKCLACGAQHPVRI